ncbi:hypothetical protein AIIKEEIJ_00585 [Rhodococcus sp. YH1]|nr:hypothetical protein [Rhodococcus sp. YH1]
MFHTGAPIGTDTTSASVTSWNVTSTAASVGPYRLCTLTPGSTDRTRAATAAARASPDAKTYRNDEIPPTADSATNTASIDGTKCATVTDRARMTAARYPGSRWPSGAATTSRAPTCNGQKNSHTDTSNVNGVFCNTTSSAVSPYRPCIHTRRLTIAACETPTPFGRPVDPDVKITYAVFDGRNGAVRSASVNGASDSAATSTASTASTRTDDSAGASNPSRVVVSTTTGSATSRM